MSVERGSRLPPAPNGQRAAARRPTRTALKRELRRLARDFADDLVELLERHGMWDLSQDDEPGDLGAKRVRRTTAALERVAARIVEDLKSRRRPVAISTVAKGLGMTPREIAHPMSLLVTRGRVVRSGERRGARYRLAGKRGAKRATKRRMPSGHPPPKKVGRTQTAGPRAATRPRAKGTTPRKRVP